MGGTQCGGLQCSKPQCSRLITAEEDDAEFNEGDMVPRAPTVGCDPALTKALLAMRKPLRGVEPLLPLVGQSLSEGGSLWKDKLGLQRANTEVSVGFGEEESSNEDSVVLAWLVNVTAQAHAPSSKLLALREQITTTCNLFNAEVLEDHSINGLILTNPMGRMTAEDCAVRLGQLICRWAAMQQLGLCVGVHCGCLRHANIGGRVVHFGDASAEAMQLTASSGRDWMVHMSSQVKERLSALKHARLQVSPDQGYYLDLVSPVNATYSGERLDVDNSGAQEDGYAMHINMQTTLSNDMCKRTMTIEAFEEMLTSHGVDVTKFGKFPAKSIKDFYTAVVVEQKCSLVLEGGAIHRVLNLLRISLCIRDAENRLRELRIASEQCKDGKRRRDQPLAVVLKMNDSKWQDAIETCLQQTLNLSPQVQKACLEIDFNSYSYDEHRSASDTIPDIMTTYRSHNIRINVKDRKKKELRCIGLPDGVQFSREAGAVAARTWMWAPVGNKNEDELMSTLQRNGFDVSEFPPQAFAELYDEVYDQGLSTLQEKNGVLVRAICIVKLWLHADILNVDHVLVVKAKWQRGECYAMEKDHGISMRMGVDQPWEDAAEEALTTRLGVTREWVRQHLAIDLSSHKLTEELGYSRSFNGLTSLYVVNEASVHVTNSSHEQVGVIGLPAGTDFTFARRSSLKGPETEDTVVTNWCWKTVEDVEQSQENAIRATLSVHAAVTDSGAREERDADEDGLTMLSVPTSQEELFHFRSRVPDPDPIHLTPDLQKQDPCLLAVLMKGQKTDWKRARNAAQRIRDQDYSCKDFFKDITAAFPELRLYCIEQDASVKEAGKSQPPPRVSLSKPTSSGRSASNEYQRTIGALFAVFWLMRLDLDGKESFCYGLDSHWQPRSSQAGREEEEARKRANFYEKFDWRMLRNLMIDAELLVMNSGVQGRPGLKHDAERTLACLVLMAIHDIMKLTVLLPTVSAKVGEFAGYKAGEAISDHDIALSYVLVHRPELLPSFAGLGKVQQDSIRFTQCKMDYNMGWLVQGEAPPGALFKTMRRMATGAVRERDIAFYFVHWFCDLAAAEPCPLEGMDKFVLKFPLRVLGQFLESFGVVQTLSETKTETMVFEDYLVERWHRHEPSLGHVPTGPGSVAKMRLVLMAQGDSHQLLKAFNQLPIDDQTTLAQEMARTGVREQSFQRDPLVGSSMPGKGPAILIYYAPALMQKAGRENPGDAMRILANIYRASRRFWPLTADRADVTVTVRIDALKDLEISAALRPDAGSAWYLEKTSGQDASVKLLPLGLKDLDVTTHAPLSCGDLDSEARKTKSRRPWTNLPRVRRFPFVSGSRTSG